MADIINFPSPKVGGQCFMMCPCTPEGTPFNVIAIVDERPFISGLICPECEAHIDVNNGYIGNVNA